MATHDYSPYLNWIDAQASAARAELQRLAAINSGSFNAEGVTGVARRMLERYAALGKPELIEMPPYRDVADDGAIRDRPLGRGLRIRTRPDAPLRVFLCGHLDTVFPASSPFQSTRLLDDDTLCGPGVADLKGGLLVMWLALAALERSPWKEKIGWEVLLNPDEEIGSLASAPLLAEAAARNQIGLVYEPAFSDGALASSRKGSGNFDFVVHGRAAHAGRDFARGRNAIAAMADLIRSAHALNAKRRSVTVNPGYVRGGGAVNVVPDLALFKFNVRTSNGEDEAWLRKELNALAKRANAKDGFKVELRGGFTRPPKPISRGMSKLMDYVSDCGRRLGFEPEFRPTGGCCDGNNLAAAGLPNLDNLGVVGGEIHSEREYMRLSSLPQRARLSALLLLRLASGELKWH